MPFGSNEATAVLLYLNLKKHARTQEMLKVVQETQSTGWAVAAGYEFTPVSTSDEYRETDARIREDDDFKNNLVSPLL